MSIETFTNSLPGRPVVALLTFIAGITVISRGGKKVTPLDTPKGTVITGIAVLGAAIIAIRIVAIVS
jgi:hypothetical protein